jgi:hypothetical protein
MYSLLQERNQLKYLVLQLLLIGISGVITEKLVEILVEEKHLFPESFALESVVFLAIWFCLDWLVCSILRLRSFLQSFANRTISRQILITLAIAWLVASLFFRFYSFMLEFAAMLMLWWVLDFLSSRMSRTMGKRDR